MPSPVPTLSIETVAVCNFRCVMCPTLGMKSKDMGYMSAQTFARVLESVRGAVFVDMTGWGEPLLDEHIFDRVAAVRAAGTKCAITSNGSLFNAENRKRLFASGMDVLNISIDSSRAGVFNEIRQLGDWQTVASNIGAIAAEKRRRGGKGPLLRSTFVLMRSNAHTLCDWVAYMAGIGFDEVCVKPPDVIWSPEVLAMQLPLEEARQSVRQADETAARAGIRFATWNFDGHYPQNDCLVKVFDTTLHIDWRGNVSPCCNLGHAVERVVEHEGRVHTFPMEQRVFGNVNESSIGEIWNSKPYADFRRSFQCGEVPVSCHGCALVKPHAVDASLLKIN